LEKFGGFFSIIQPRRLTTTEFFLSSSLCERKKSQHNFEMGKNNNNRNNDWKDRLNVVYSTNPDFAYETDDEQEAETLEPGKQNLKVSIDRKQRAGKSVTLVQGFVGTDDDLKELARMLKNKCGVGGSAKEGEIIVQGEFKQKVYDLLLQAGYKVKMAGGN